MVCLGTSVVQAAEEQAPTRSAAIETVMLSADAKEINPTATEVESVVAVQKDAKSTELVGKIPLGEGAAILLNNDELAELAQLEQADKTIADQVGGADEEFWKAAAIGAGVVILLIIIF